jgi:sister chromatid cohesion protein DCC1
VSAFSLNGYHTISLSRRLIQKAIGSSLTIKGKPTDDAVICTPTSTFQLRTISLSNSLLVLEQPETQPIAASSSAASSTNAELHLKDTIHEILELIPIVPRLNRIEKILKEGAWSGMNPEASLSSLGLREEMVGQDEMGQGRRKRRMESEGGVSSPGS